MGRSANKVMTSVRLSVDAKSFLKDLSNKFGISQGATVELSLRIMHKFWNEGPIMTPQILAELKALHAKLDQDIKNAGANVPPGVKALHAQLGTALSANVGSVNWQQILSVLIQILSQLGPIIFPPTPAPAPVADNTP
jgi:hypothetical protein